MKKKDLIYLVLAVVILLVAGYIIFLNLAPKGSAQSGVEVDVVGEMPDSMHAAGLSAMTDPAKSKDFSSPVDYTGLNNTAPFGK